MTTGAARAIGLGASAIAACGVAATAGGLARSRLRRPTGEPGELTEVDGLTLHSLVHRAGGPTVVFENGLCCPCTTWSWVLDGIADRYSYVAYDRPGNGWSGDDGKRRSAREINELAAELVAHYDLPAPYVLVGHSIGGLLGMSFAAAMSHDVAGLVLVDSSHPEQLVRSSAQRDSMPMVDHAMGALFWRTLLGRKPSAPAVSFLDDLPPHQAARTKSAMERPSPWRAALREVRTFYAWSDELRTATLPSSLPVAVVTAGQTDVGDSKHRELQSELAALSEVGSHVVVPGADHDGIVMRQDDATHVIDAIEWTIAQSMAQPQRTRGV
ncbi:alpha/beta hydrolase [Prauserella cavernicola]|uniref:Alpha/beta hydrolase n=1 Tax=Prauserella cavernicola TaxID=2800127 RepID=A0A934QVE3_9PSEU|nr:alpha/beta hydrolase [Prauserella cavernicola]MBK1787266.1 alpha/beta hydrolase [Prauserella cavernicola]